MRTLAIFLVCASEVCASASAAHAETDHSAIARAALAEVIRPGYAALAEETAALNNQVGALCETPSSSSLEAGRKAFASAVAAWSNVEILRFGPIVADHRYESVLFWTERTERGRRQLRN